MRGEFGRERGQCQGETHTDHGGPDRVRRERRPNSEGQAGEAAADREERGRIALPAATPLDEVTAYLDAFVRFLAHSPAGAAYRTLLGAAPHNPAVRELLSANDVRGNSARAVLNRITTDP